MRWIWIDRITEFERGVRAVAIKNITAAEDVLHDHFPARAALPAAGPLPPRPARPPMPLMPHPLVIEGMAQTAGILVGHANDFREKVILAKIAKASFTATAGPGTTLRYTASIERLDDSGASTAGTVDRLDPLTGHATPMAHIELMFSHIDQNRAGTVFPEHNFVFGPQFRELLDRSGIT
jgi:3-hydroxyacyl-[acyl-carrier-protein] dehydratase